MTFSRKIFWILILFLFCCSKNEKKVNETILAQVGDKTVSVNEFIRRAEYTVRPTWCKNDDYIARKIVLNSLIAEKLLALEAGQLKVITENEEIALYLQGRKEQAMRQIHYDQTAKQKVDLSQTDLSLPLRMSERTYDITLIPINDDKLAARIKKDITAKNTNFQALSEEFSLATQQELISQEISFDSPVEDAIFNSLFMSEIKDEQVIGPVKIEKNRHALLKVNGWTRRAILSEKSAEQTKKDLEEKITQIAANDIYLQWIANTMQGKTLDFYPATFEALLNIIGPDYFKTSEDKEAAFNKKFWDKDESEVVLDDMSGQMAKILDDPLLKINDEVWTVRRFEKEIKKHPLVFRNKKMPQSEFTNEFRLAIADLIRDQYITEDAYQRGIDNDPRVLRTSAMWQDNIASLYHKSLHLKDISQKEMNALQLVTKHLDPLIEQLQSKYDEQIYINTDEFEKIKLSSIDMFVIQKNVPFPVVVPQFPILTTYNKLDYGQKMTNEE